MERLRDLPGLGPKSEAWLIEVGITSPEVLRAVGPIGAFIALRKHCSTRPGMNFLYALVGATEGKHWLAVAREEKSQLIMALEGYRELEQLLNEEGLEL